jgi:hypothetical protein
MTEQGFGTLHALVQAPTVPAQLAQFGLVFDPSCSTDPNYCVARRNITGDFDVTINLSPPAAIPPFINIGGAQYPSGQYSGSGTGTATFVLPDGTVKTSSQMDFVLKGDYSTAKIASISMPGLFTGTEPGGASFSGRSTIDIDDVSNQTGKAKLWIEGQPSWTPSDFDLTYGCTPSGRDCGIASIHLRGKFLSLGAP